MARNENIVLSLKIHVAVEPFLGPFPDKLLDILYLLKRHMSMTSAGAEKKK